MSSVSERIISVRHEKNLTAAEFSRSLQISHPTLLKWERGTALPNGQSLIKLYQVFGISPDYVLLGIDRGKKSQ